MNTTKLESIQDNIMEFSNNFISESNNSSFNDSLVQPEFYQYISKSDGEVIQL